MIVPDIQGLDKGLADAPMHEKALERLERVARNMPIKSSLQMGHVPSSLGRIYLFWGLDGHGHFHGGWGIRIGDQDIARTVEFKSGTSEAEVKQTLVVDAYGFADLSNQRHMHDEGWWTGAGVQ